LPKGHSTFETRIKALELQVGTVHSQIYDDLTQRIQTLERRIAEMNEAFSRATFPRAPQQQTAYGSTQ
jgi:hypothetical protein